MNIKLTISLIALAAIAVILYFVNPFMKEEEKKIPEPWFYQVHVDDMTYIQIYHLGASASFVKTKSDSWAFDMPELIPPDHNRWGGIDFILGGPQTRRDLSETTILKCKGLQEELDFWGGWLESTHPSPMRNNH